MSHTPRTRQWRSLILWWSWTRVGSVRPARRGRFSRSRRARSLPVLSAVTMSSRRHMALLPCGPTVAASARRGADLTCPAESLSWNTKDQSSEWRYRHSLASRQPPCCRMICFLPAPCSRAIPPRWSGRRPMHTASTRWHYRSDNDLPAGFAAVSACGLHRHARRNTEDGSPSRACLEVSHAVRSSPRRRCRRRLARRRDATALVRSDPKDRDDSFRYANDHGHPEQWGRRLSVLRL